MRIRPSSGAAILLILFSAVDYVAQKIKPSTPEELSMVVKVARLLETDPLGKDSRKNRKWLSDWIAHKKIFAVPSCSDFLASDKKKYKYREELSFQIRASTAAFIVEHADEATDPAARILAGITGMLKSYAIILQKNPQLDSEYLNSLLEAQNKNQLETRLREVMTRCSDVPLSDKNPRSATGEVLYASIEVERPAVVTEIPFPVYVPSARRNFTQGKVILHVVLSSTGKVTDVFVIQGLPDGLTESSINAAKAIKFDPALMRDKPISTIVKIEYRFIASG